MQQDSKSPRQQDKKKQKRRIPKKATKSHLENAALHYLERFATSSENLRSVLMRRVSRSAYYHETDPGEGAEWVNDIIGRFIETGLLDDRVYTEGRVRSLYAKGNSRKTIHAKLRAKGVPADIIDEALEQQEDEEDGDPELAAARRLAKRRRLGPYRDASLRLERKEKDLAALARAGFSYHIARQVIEEDEPDMSLT